MYFRYGPEQTDYLKKKDKKLGANCKCKLDTRTVKIS